MHNWNFPEIEPWKCFSANNVDVNICEIQLLEDNWPKMTIPSHFPPGFQIHEPCHVGDTTPSKILMCEGPHVQSSRSELSIALVKSSLKYILKKEFLSDPGPLFANSCFIPLLSCPKYQGDIKQLYFKSLLIDETINQRLWVFKDFACLLSSKLMGMKVSYKQSISQHFTTI